jgi:hypothetical protein
MIGILNRLVVTSEELGHPRHKLAYVKGTMMDPADWKSLFLLSWF